MEDRREELQKKTISTIMLLKKKKQKTKTDTVLKIANSYLIKSIRDLFTSVSSVQSLSRVRLFVTP